MSFKARFEGGFCPTGCGMRIHTGDAVTFDEGDRLVHDECVPKASKYDIAPGETVCGTHWLVKPCPYCDE